MQIIFGEPLHVFPPTSYLKNWLEIHKKGKKQLKQSLSFSATLFINIKGPRLKLIGLKIKCRTLLIIYSCYCCIFRPPQHECHLFGAQFSKKKRNIIFVMCLKYISILALRFDSIRSKLCRIDGARVRGINASVLTVYFEKKKYWKWRAIKLDQLTKSHACKIRLADDWIISMNHFLDYKF